MKKFKNYTLLRESLYLTNMFDFPEWGDFNPATVLKLSALFEERDNLVEHVETSDYIQEWMDFGSVNTFDDLLDSENQLIKILKSGKVLSAQEKKILDLTLQIKSFLIKKPTKPVAYYVYDKNGKELAFIQDKGATFDITIGKSFVNKETFATILNDIIKKRVK